MSASAIPVPSGLHATGDVYVRSINFVYIYFSREMRTRFHLIEKRASVVRFKILSLSLLYHLLRLHSLASYMQGHLISLGFYKVSPQILLPTLFSVLLFFIHKLILSYSRFPNNFQEFLQRPLKSKQQRFPESYLVEAEIIKKRSSIFASFRILLSPFRFLFPPKSHSVI